MFAFSRFAHQKFPFAAPEVFGEAPTGELYHVYGDELGEQDDSGLP